MALTKIEPRRNLDEYIGMDVVTRLDVNNKEAHEVVLSWMGDITYNRAATGQDSHGPYPTRVEAIAAARDFGRTVNAHRAVLGLQPKGWRYA